LNPTRRILLKAAVASLGSAAFSARAGANQPPLLFGTTPVILDEQAAFLARWRVYLETLLLRPVRFVQRGSYREILVIWRARSWIAPGCAVTRMCA